MVFIEFPSLCCHNSDDHLLDHHCFFIIIVFYNNILSGLQLLLVERLLPDTNPFCKHLTQRYSGCWWSYCGAPSFFNLYSVSLSHNWLFSFHNFFRNVGRHLNLFCYRGVRIPHSSNRCEEKRILKVLLLTCLFFSSFLCCSLFLYIDWR